MIKTTSKLFKVKELNPASYNPRTISDEALNGLKNSIGEFGYLQNIIVNIRDDKNTIVGGHQRLKALDLNIHDEIECVIVDLDEIKEKALNIALNSKHISGEFDIPELESILQELKVDFDGFEDINLDALVEEFDFDLDIGEEGETNTGDEDAIPEEPENIFIKLGDLIELGNHRLLCGDSTKKEDVEKLMDGEKADMVFTDPPYGVNYQSNMRTKSKKFDQLTNDDNILDFSPILEKYSKGWVFVWTSWKVQNKWVESLSKFGYPTNMVIWHKPGGGIGDLKKTFSTDYEIALIWHRGAELCGKRIGSVWTIRKDGATKYLHPTQKPAALAEEAISKTTKIKASILDLFLGSGSTLIACEKTNRKCYGMELDEKYCQVIIQRWCDYIGKDKVAINGQEVSWKEFLGDS